MDRKEDGSFCGVQYRIMISEVTISVGEWYLDENEMFIDAVDLDPFDLTDLKGAMALFLSRCSDHA